MKLNRNFIIQESDGKSILVPTGAAEFAGIVRGNKTFGAILSLLKEETTEEQIISAMRKRFNASEEEITRDVKKSIKELRKIGAVDG